MALLHVRDLRTEFSTSRGTLRAVNGIDFSLEEGEVLAIVGESGSGKSITALSIMGLLPGATSRTTGEIRFRDQDLVKMTPQEYRRVRGTDIAMVFQNPLTALDPAFTIGNQLIEIIGMRTASSRKDRKQEAERVLHQVGITDTQRVLQAYPHELSGGMRQRVVIAMAVSRRPKLIIADEPTTALDATIQKQILQLLARINRESNTAIILITHDFGVVANISNRVAVMYAGKIVEYGKTADIIARPLHPYTQGLIGSVPDAGFSRREPAARRRLVQISGAPPDLLNLPLGCVFSERCPEAKAHCRTAEPQLSLHASGSSTACFEREELSYESVTRG
ncbi:ABC transporter ATP-binding protein [Paenibacillus sp. FSL H8-0548]|uniref:ABC transporter ATP-binding protein n=1 Tax=Paenibacillus sp. FSL H8-0548 TaxID=1920422 RepID=UPI0009FADC31|nr:ABC transporter ATP-binding protein [Paenibacillus sp. FSL H8-0548]